MLEYTHVITNAQTGEVTYVPFTEEEIANSKNWSLSPEVVNETSLNYLESTDWYVTRFIETGVAIPSDIVKLRAQARKSIV